MDLNYSAADIAFRQEVRSWLEANLPAEIREKVLNHRRPNRDDLVRWHKILAGKGWSAPHWPVDFGGTGWNATQRHIWDEENARVGAPGVLPFGVAMVAPVIMKYGNAEQKSYYLPRILDCTDWWCQGYSEPGSGSDLASLKTRAELTSDGKHYIVNGQKTWTTLGQHADMIFCLVRTDPEAKKQEGISFLLIDMKTPGITVRPIRSIDDAHHLNETFFEDVRVPVGNLIGEEGAGWNITKYLLNNEHATTADLPDLRRYMRELRRIATTLDAGDGKLIDRPEFALRLARLDADLEAIAMLVQRVAQLDMAHHPASHLLGSILKLRATELQQRITEAQTEALGDHGAVAYAHWHDAPPAEAFPMQDLARGIANDMFLRRAATIYGGTSEVQRGIIAKLMFQL
ncbi:MAG TPA: acyl-CoA dehydrogenase [Cupriavidus sp.]|nr:acyl-CoA dehydrogenase [Cupriavidus sp.]